MITAEDARDNAHLLYEIKSDLGATSFGSISGFFDVSPKWRCPCCYRSKAEMARLDKNGGVLCAIHYHHDHFGEHSHARIREKIGEAWGVRSAISASLERFAYTMICNDCNVAEPYAKNIAGAPENFSFAPYEIANFIQVRPNLPHTVDEARVKLTYEAARPAMRLLALRLNAILRAGQSGTDEMEPLAAPAWRVLKDVRAKMKENG